ncbi:hypothetical protein PAEPH01_1400 [Pancytospora epiphaga]|nr:hypothetical protein PAEPH01_1400 [Pancytospora epiphaga]
MIQLKESIPITTKPYGFPPKILGQTKAEIDKLINLGIIQPSTSPYSAPAFSILKKNNEVYLVVDYCRLDKVTVFDGFPFSSAWDTLRSLNGNQIFTQIDLRNGYHQMPLDETDWYLTSFVTPIGQYKYTRLPFELTNAPRAF